MSVLDLHDIESERISAATVDAIQAEKQVRIALATSWPRPVRLEWHAGKGSRQSIITLLPGRSIVQPLAKAQAWLGPFYLPIEYRLATDDGRRERLMSAYAIEKKRVLDRYDYERHVSVGMKGGPQPIGPHRFPDITVTIYETDGEEMPPIRLHELYKIGEFDPIKDTFGVRETAAEVQERYEAEIREAAQRHEREIADLKSQIAGAVGLIKGYVSGQSATPPAAGAA